jgi:hypothetical protein
MKTIFLFLLLACATPFAGSTQTWKFDTTWVAGDDVAYEAMVTDADYLETCFSDGRLFVTGRSKVKGRLPHFFYLDTREVTPVARAVPFKGLPEKLFKDAKTGIIQLQPEKVYYVPEHNRIIWNTAWSVTVTDTNFNFIKHFYEPYTWKQGKDRYYMDRGLCVNASYYIRFVNSQYERKDFHGKREGIARFGKYLAPGLPDDQFPGIRPLDIHSILEAKKAKLKPGPQVHFQKCDTVHIRWVDSKQAIQLTEDSVLWFVDDFGRNLVRYHMPTNKQNCYSFMHNRSPFISDDAYDILPQRTKMNERNEIEFRKLNFYDLFPTIIHHAERGRTGILQNYEVFVNEEEDVVFRSLGMSTNDSILINTLMPYIPEEFQFTPDYSKRMSYWLVEYRTLSTMEPTHFMVIPSKNQNVIMGDANGFTMLESLWDGDIRKWALIRVSHLE